MKSFTCLFTFFLALIMVVNAQNGVGIGTATPNANALLDVSSTSKGVLIPRLNSTQMNAITSPAGIIIYNTDSNAFAYRNATAWVFLKGNATASNDWSTKGNAGTDPAVNFIGTTDNQDLVFKRSNSRAGFLHINNTSWGVSALNQASTGFQNTAIGTSALFANTTGAQNTASGTIALFGNVTGNNNTANGFAALFSNNTGYSNVAVGTKTLYNCANISNLVAIGDSALFNNGLNTTETFEGTGNTAVGSKVLFSNTIGANNTAQGYEALYSNISGYRNTAFGYHAGRSNETGSGNVFIGTQAGVNETGSNKLYINNDADAALLYGEFDNNKLQVHNKLGIGRLPAAFPLEIQGLGINSDLVKFFNTAGAEKWHFNLLANGSLNFVETNVADNRLVMAVGGEVGVGKIPSTSFNDSRLQVKQKNDQNAIGMEAGNSSNHWDFYLTDDGASNLVLYYNGSNKGSFDNATGAYIANSDRRMKKDITPQVAVLNNVMQLQAYQYHYLDNQPTDRFSNGFMAQDVQKIFPDAVVENTMKDGETRLGINYQYFTVLAIKGLQEQQKEMEAMKAQIKLMMEEIAKLKAK